MDAELAAEADDEHVEQRGYLVQIVNGRRRDAVGPGQADEEAPKERGDDAGRAQRVPDPVLIPASCVPEIALQPQRRHRFRAIISSSHSAVPLVRARPCRPRETATARRAAGVDRHLVDGTGAV